MMPRQRMVWCPARMQKHNRTEHAHTHTHTERFATSIRKRNINTSENNAIEPFVLYGKSTANHALIVYWRVILSIWEEIFIALNFQNISVAFGTWILFYLMVVWWNKDFYTKFTSLRSLCVYTIELSLLNGCVHMNVNSVLCHKTVFYYFDFNLDLRVRWYENRIDAFCSIK